MTRIDQLQAKLDARMLGPKALPGYGRNVDAIRKEMARLRGEQFDASPISEATEDEIKAARAVHGKTEGSEQQ